MPASTSVSEVGKPKSADQIQLDWDTNPRWKGITRTYTAADVVALQGTVVEEHTLARRGALRPVAGWTRTTGCANSANASGPVLIFIERRYLPLARWLCGP